MSQVITAPNIDLPKYPTVFLGGGITGCDDWQKDVIKYLEDEDITIFNPRRESFDVSDKSSTIQQIEWEFKKLERADIFSMYFCDSDSVQPICLYELGRNVVRMQSKYPLTWKARIIVGCERGYKRAEDVLYQLGYAMETFTVDMDTDPLSHAWRIREALAFFQFKGEV